MPKLKKMHRPKKGQTDTKGQKSAMTNKRTDEITCIRKITRQNMHRRRVGQTKNVQLKNAGRKTIMKPPEHESEYDANFTNIVARDSTLPFDKP